MNDLTAAQKRILLEKTNQMVRFNILSEDDFTQIMRIFSEALDRMTQLRGEE